MQTLKKSMVKKRNSLVLAAVHKCANVWMGILSANEKIYCLFGANPYFKLESKIYPSKSPRMDLKCGPRVAHAIKNDHLYGTEVSFVLLRPKNKVKLLTQSANKLDVHGEMGMRVFGELFSRASERP